MWLIYLSVCFRINIDCYHSYDFSEFRINIQSLQMDKKQSLEQCFVLLDTNSLEQQPNVDMVVVSSDLNDHYFKQISLNAQISDKIREEWKPMLKQANIIYHQSDRNSELITIEIVSHSINYEIIELKVHCGPFEFNLNLYNTLDSSPFCKLPTNAKGSFGKIIFTDLFQKEAAIKIFQFGEKSASLEEQLVDALRQYSFLKIASALEVGPALFQQAFFDIVIFQNSIEFQMQKCVEYQNWSTGQLSLNLGQLKDNLKVLHAFNIVHMDVKSQNICYSPFLKKYVFIDFGFSNYIKEKMGEKSTVRFSGSLRYCSKQMIELYLSNDFGSVDLYDNDVGGLLLSMEEIQAYFKDLARLKELEVGSFRQFGREYSYKPIVKEGGEKRVRQIMDTLQMKLLLFHNSSQGVIDKINRSSISIQDIQSFFDELEPTPKLIQLYSIFSARYNRNQKLEHRFVHRINYQLSKRNMVKFDCLFNRIDFLQHYHVKSREDRFNKSRQRVQIRGIIFDLKSIVKWHESVYYKIFVDFVSINSNVYSTTQSQRKLAVATFYQVIQSKQEGREFIELYARMERQQSEEAKDETNSCLCFLLSECSKVPITDWKQQYFILVFEQIVLIGGGTAYFLKARFKQFISNCRDQEASVRSLVGVQASLEWQNSIYYQIPKYRVFCVSFFSSVFKQIQSRCKTQEERNICFLYTLTQNFRFCERVLYGDMNLDTFARRLDQTNFRKKQFKHEINIFMVVCYLSNVVGGRISYSEYGRYVKVLETEQIKDKHRVQYFNSLIVSYYRIVNRYEQLLEYYHLFLRVFGEQYVLRMHVRADVLVLQYTCSVITVNEYVTELYRMYEANDNKSVKGRMQEIYLAISPQHRKEVVTPQSLSKIQMISRTIQLNEQLAERVFVSFDLLNIFHTYYMIHKAQPNIIEHMQNILDAIIKCFEEFAHKETYEKYFLCRYTVLKTKLLCWQERYVQALQVFRELVERQIYNEQATLIVIYSLNCSFNIKLLYTNLSIDSDIEQIYQLCKNWSCFSEYFVLANCGQLMTKTFVYLFKRKGLQFLNFVFQICFFYRNIYNGIISISQVSSESKSNLIELSIQKLLPLINQNPYICLYFSILMRIVPVKDLLKLLTSIAKALAFVVPFVKTTVLSNHYFYYYAQQLRRKAKKKKHVIQLHFRSVHHYFSIAQINRHCIRKSSFPTRINPVFRLLLKEKLLAKFRNGQNLKNANK